MFDNKTQRDLFFQSSEFFELIRREDNSFQVKFENPLDGNLADLTISVDGLLSRYLSVDRPNIEYIDSNQSETINVNGEFETAVKASTLLAQLENNIARSAFRCIETPNTFRIFSLARLAFEPCDYATALEPAKEAELTFGLEVKGEFNLFYWLVSNWVLTIGILFALLVAVYMFYLGVKIIWFKRKLRELKSESTLLLSLISGVQKRCFVENKMSIGEYYDALSQFERRLAVISEDFIEYGPKLSNFFAFRSVLLRLGEEKSKLFGLLKATQKEYFEKGLVETRIYHTKVASLTKKLSEVEEQIVLEEYKKTKRVTKGFFKGLWNLCYKVR